MKTIRVTSILIASVLISTLSYSQLGLGVQSRSSAALGLRTNSLGVHEIHNRTAATVNSSTEAAANTSRRAKRRAARSAENARVQSQNTANASSGYIRNNAENGMNTAAHVYTSSNTAASNGTSYRSEPAERNHETSVRSEVKTSGTVSANTGDAGKAAVTTKSNSAVNSSITR